MKNEQMEMSEEEMKKINTKRIRNPFGNTGRLLLLLLPLLTTGMLSCEFLEEQDFTIKLRGEAFKNSDGSPMEGVKIILYRTRGQDQETRVQLSEAVTDAVGKFDIIHEIEADHCDEYRYWVFAWLYVDNDWETPFQMAEPRPVKCQFSRQYLELILRMSKIAGNRQFKT